MTAPAWRRSSRCESAGCLEAAHLGGGRYLLRNTTDPGPVIPATRDEIDVFMAGWIAGEFGGDALAIRRETPNEPPGSSVEPRNPVHPHPPHQTGVPTALRAAESPPTPAETIGDLHDRLNPGETATAAGYQVTRWTEED